MKQEYKEALSCISESGVGNCMLKEGCEFADFPMTNTPPGFTAGRHVNITQTLLQY